jgi:anti-anti-sigma regulatory factor
MSVRLDGNIIVLEGICRVEDAEPLLRWLQADPGCLVDLSEAEHLHTAVIQVLMALKPVLKGTAKDAFLRNCITSAFATMNPSGTTPQDG